MRKNILGNNPKTSVPLYVCFIPGKLMVHDNKLRANGVFRVAGVISHNAGFFELSFRITCFYFSPSK